MKSLLYTAFCVLIVASFTGCQLLVAHDPANQAAINNRQRYDAAAKMYASVEREIIVAYQSGAISKPLATSLIDDMQNVVKPLKAAAEAALISGDFATVIVKLEAATTSILVKSPSKPTAPLTSTTLPKT